MSETRFGVPRFPSLVESALAAREPKWRELDLALERMAEASSSSPVLRDLTVEEEEEANRLFKRVRRFDALAERFGVSADAVKDGLRRVRRRKQGYRAYNRPSPEVEAKARELRRQGLSLRAIAQAVGLKSPASVSRIVKEGAL